MTFAMLRFQRIYQLGCLPCRRMGYFSACQVHHLNLGQHAGQVRLGDEHTIGLCPWHHVGEPIRVFTVEECRQLLGPSMKHEPVRFREFFGSDAALLAWENELIQRAESMVIGRNLQPGHRPSMRRRLRSTRGSSSSTTAPPAGITRATRGSFGRSAPVSNSAFGSERVSTCKH